MADEQKAATKYLLNELNENERKEFEAHFFECPICADLVRQNLTVSENLKDVLSDLYTPAPIAERSPTTSWWGRWLRPVTLVTSFAALALAFLLIRPDADVLMVESRPEATIVAPNARGAGVQKTIALSRSDSHFDLTFSVDGFSKPELFRCDFQTDAGSPITTYTTPKPTQSDFTLKIRTKLFPPGRYKTLVRPVSDPSTPQTTYLFAIEHSK